MIDVGPGAYIYCYEYDVPTTTVMRAIKYAPYISSNDDKLSNVVSLPLNFPEKDGEMVK